LTLGREDDGGELGWDGDAIDVDWLMERGWAEMRCDSDVEEFDVDGWWVHGGRTTDEQERARA
jgi:hypothetical protein